MSSTAETRRVAQNVANVYAEPDTSSELASQAVLGERVHVLEHKNGFCRIETEDRYGGWMEARLLAPHTDLSDRPQAAVSTLFADVYAHPDPHSEILTKLTAGTRIEIARRAEPGSWVGVYLPDTQAGYVHQVNFDSAPDRFQKGFEGAWRTPVAPISRISLISALGINCAETAKRLIGTPYLWGGTTPFGIDCSGLTQLVYKLNGIQLLRDARLQFTDRRFMRVEEGQSLETAILDAGDLIAFSRRDDKRPTHIGVALGEGRFLHARGGHGVRVDFCDSEEYAAAYLGAVRLSADADFSVQSA